MVSSFVPFVGGGARSIVSWLEAALTHSGVEVDVFELPFSDDPRTLAEEAVAFRMLDLAAGADRMVTIRPPCHLLRHTRKRVWFIHHIRSFYDLWGTEFSAVPDSPRGRALRRAVVEMDDCGLSEAERVFTNSAVVTDRLKRFNGLPSEVLYPPIFQPERFRCTGYGDEVVYICRVERHKRQHLMVEAMAHTRTPVRLRICGASADLSYRRVLQETVLKLGLEQKVSLELDWIAEERKTALLGECLAAAYVPLDEDSYGYPSLEAHHAEKAVITCSDSGGTLELVRHGDNGFIAEPDPGTLAAAMDRLYLDRTLARRMGRRGRERIKEIGVTWERVVEAFAG